MAITAALMELGEASNSELVKATGFDTKRVGAVLGRMRVKNTMHPKRVYIARWVTDSEDGGREFARAVYALGSKACAKKPAPLGSVAHRRRLRNDCAMQVASVFDLGRPKGVRVERGARVRAMVVTPAVLAVSNSL